MIGRIILTVLVLLLGIVLFTPAGVRLSYESGALRVAVRFGSVRVDVYPPKKKQPEKEPKAKKEKVKAAEPAAEKTKTPVNREQIFYSLEVLPPILGKALRRVGKSLRFDPLKIYLLVAGRDPADTAVLYGRLEAVLAAGLPVFHRLSHIKNQDIRLFLDFSREEMDCIADVGVSLRLWDVLVMLVCAGFGALRWYKGFRKLADKPVQATEKTDHAAADQSNDPVI